ncbi:phospholipase A2 inhibitor PIP-like [Phyllobates terribilis]|uniref:phospholipase A2 inhibitor PIP-like n=1 Tax=Phyllobates terribilis TaxID=111132 RepID=UPI003CCAFC60
MSSVCLLCALLVVLFSAGDAIRCIICRDYSGGVCTGDPMTCPSDSNVCLSTLVQYDINSTDPQPQNVLQSIGAVSPLTYVRDCGYLEKCTEVVILRTPYSRTVAINSCCKTDLCTPEPPTALPETLKNGLTCAGCFQITPDTCQSYEPVQCRGNEVKCFSYTNLPLNNNVTLAISGCATKTACNLELEEDKRQTLCTGGLFSGTESVHSSVLLFPAAILLKSMY